MSPAAAQKLFDDVRDSYATASGLRDHSVYRRSRRSKKKPYLFSSPSLHECREWIERQALKAVRRKAAA